MLNSAVAIILDEHRSLATVANGLNYLLHEIHEGKLPPDFRLLSAMVSYLDDFTEQLHHPRESAYLFARLRRRTREADVVIDDLERQHLAGTKQLSDLKRVLGRYEAGTSGGFDAFSAAAEKFADETTRHMALEETVVLPLAQKHLTAKDWVEICAAFGQNGELRFAAEIDRRCRELYAQIVRFAPPPIGEGEGPVKQ